MLPETSASLLERLRDPADGRAWQRLVDLYTPLIHGWLARHGVKQPDLDDLTQDVLVVLVREMPGFQHTERRGAFRHWLRMVTVNRLRGFWRGQSRIAAGMGDGKDLEQTLDELENADSALSRLWDEEHNRHVAHRLLELIEPEFTATTWQAFRRQVLEGHPAREVAAALGISVNAVLIAKSRVLQRLRQEKEGLID